MSSSPFDDLFDDLDSPWWRGGRFLASIRSELRKIWSQRMEAGELTQAEIARRLDLSKSRVSRLLSGEGNLTIRSAGALAAAMDFDLKVTSVDTSVRPSESEISDTSENTTIEYVRIRNTDLDELRVNKTIFQHHEILLDINANTFVADQTSGSPLSMGVPMQNLQGSAFYMRNAPIILPKPSART